MRKKFAKIFLFDSLSRDNPADREQLLKVKH